MYFYYLLRKICFIRDTFQFYFLNVLSHKFRDFILLLINFL